MLHYLAVLHPVHRNCGLFQISSRGGDSAWQLARMVAIRRHSGHDFVALGDLILDLVVTGSRLPKNVKMPVSTLRDLARVPERAAGCDRCSARRRAGPSHRGSPHRSLRRTGARHPCWPVPVTRGCLRSSWLLIEAPPDRLSLGTAPRVVLVRRRDAPDLVSVDHQVGRFRRMLHRLVVVLGRRPSRNPALAVLRTCVRT